jgi:hypothetical protein
VFVELKRRLGFAAQFAGGQRIIALQCLSACDGISVHLDDFRLVKDLVARVDAIKLVPDGRAIFQLNRVAGRTVAGEVIYHDDTVAVRTWLQAAERPGGATLFAPSGVYYINRIELPAVGGAEGSYSLPLYNDTLLSCAGASKTTFKNTGGSATGPGVMFRSVAPAPTNIAIESCGFDWNGWNLQDYLTVIMITPHTNQSGGDGSEYPDSPQ